MPITITKITGIGATGGGPPTHFVIEGTVSGCETVYVTIDCTTDVVVPIAIPSAGVQPWSVTYKNDQRCTCGTVVTAFASCVLGMPAGATLAVSLPVTCEACPILTITADSPGPCVNGLRSVTFHASISGVAATGAVLEWDFPSGLPASPTATTAFVVTSNGALPDRVVEYAVNPLGPVLRSATLRTIFPLNCPAPPAPPASITIVIPPCPPPPCDLIVLGITLQVGVCDPVTKARTVTATASVGNGQSGDLYFWQWGSNPATSGALAGTTDQHVYAAPGTGQSTDSVTLTVFRSLTCVASKTVPVVFDGCGSDCPEILDTVIGLPGTCTADRLRRDITLDATVGGAGVDKYVWDFDDGTTLTGPGSAGPHATHEFKPGTYDVNLTAIGPGDCEASFPKQIVVEPCCPVVTDIDVTPGTCLAGATTRPVTLTAQVTGAGVTSFDWDFGDGSPLVNTTTPTAPAHDYTAPGTFVAKVTAHASGCPDVTVTKSVVVAGCPTTCPPGTTLNAQGVCVPDGGGGGLSPCAALLWVAIFLMLIGGISVVAGCVLAHFVVTSGIGALLETLGVTLHSIGVTLFAIWWLICRFLTPCAVILAVRDFVRLLIAAFAVISIILWIVGIFLPTFKGCAAASTFFGFAWGAVLAIIDFIADRRKCLIPNPAPPASSSSGLISSATSARPRPTDLPRMTARGPTGLGDVIASMTSAVGIRPCGQCQERAARLNARFPFGAAPQSGVTGPSGDGV